LRKRSKARFARHPPPDPSLAGRGEIFGFTPRK
jgi:hypothetical protein